MLQLSAVGHECQSRFFHSQKHFRVCVRTFFRPSGAVNLLHCIPRAYARGYILVPLRGSK